MLKQLKELKMITCNEEIKISKLDYYIPGTRMVNHPITVEQGWRLQHLVYQKILKEISKYQMDESSAEYLLWMDLRREQIMHSTSL